MGDKLLALDWLAGLVSQQLIHHVIKAERWTTCALEKVFFRLGDRFFVAKRKFSCGLEIDSLWL